MLLLKVTPMAVSVDLLNQSLLVRLRAEDPAQPWIRRLPSAGLASIQGLKTCDQGGLHFPLGLQAWRTGRSSGPGAESVGRTRLPSAADRAGLMPLPKKTGLTKRERRTGVRRP